MHVHIECENGEAKFWLDPVISLATYFKLGTRELNEIQKITEKHKNEIIKKWKEHFSKR